MGLFGGVIEQKDIKQILDGIEDLLVTYRLDFTVTLEGGLPAVLAGTGQIKVVDGSRIAGFCWYCF